MPMIAPAFAFFMMLAQPTTSPDESEEARPIKSLPSEQIDGYLNARGMGLAKAAELNSYPGPMHVLELRQPLDLSPKQVEQTQKIFAEMKAQATGLGRAIVERERRLDQAFAGGNVQRDELKEMVRQLGQLHSELRFAHLVAHVRTREILSAQQIETYDRLRGYDAHPKANRHGH